MRAELGPAYPGDPQDPRYGGDDMTGTWNGARWPDNIATEEGEGYGAMGLSPGHLPQGTIRLRRQVGMVSPRRTYALLAIAADCSLDRRQ